MCIPAVLSLQSHATFKMLHEHSIQWTPGVWKFRETQCSFLVLSKPGVDSPRGHAFHLNQNFLRLQKESSGILRNTNDQGTLFFLTHVTSLYQPTTYTQNDDREGKRKSNLFLFLFSAFLLFRKPKMESIGKMCRY